jgi:fecR protein
MENLNKYYDLARKIVQGLWTGSREWEDDIENGKVREELKCRFSNKELGGRLDAFERYDVKKALERVEAKRRVRRIGRVWRIGWSAAAVLIAGVITTLWLYRPEKMPEEPQLAVAENTRGAYLVVNDTERIDLATALTIEEEGITVKNIERKELSYLENIQESIAPVIHKLVTPKGSEYKLSLSDGTRVWLNTDSELSYPSSFDTVSRVVTLRGEAYFEVAKSSVPFIVRTERMDVRVLGTSFNVMSYSEEPEVQVTLEEGRVQVDAQDAHRILTPGQQAVFAKADSLLQVRNVNTEIYTGWRKGEFVFDNETFASVARKLSRWYDVEIVIDKRLENECLNGSLKRYDSIREFLSIMELTNAIDVIYSDNKVEILVKESLK